MNRILSLDLETYSVVDLATSGVYAYAASPSFSILLLAYAYEVGEVRVIDLASGEQIPESLLRDIVGNEVVKTAFNAQFERTCLAHYLKKPLSPASWRCTAVQAAALGLPLSLEAVGEVLGLEHQKLSEGRELIRFFSQPLWEGSRPVRHRPVDAPEKWERFKAYCRRDVEVEQAIRRKLADYPLSAGEQNLYCLDQEINDRGVPVDSELVEQAITADRAFREKALSEAQVLTGLDNPNSVTQLKGWLLERGVKTESLAKKTVAALIEGAEEDGAVKKLLQLRQQLAKTSVKKYEAIRRSLGPDGRVRGLLQFYGATRTGRWAGRLVQVQNLPQNHLSLSELILARNWVKAGDFAELERHFGSVPGVLSELIRTAFVPQPGYRLIVADFSAIEARVLAWLAGESWRLEVFKDSGKIYEASAARMFRVPLEEIGKGSPLRQKGKIAELALGYGGGVNALKAMGAVEMGVAETELPHLVAAWRATNLHIIRFWREIDRAALRAVKERVGQGVGRIWLEVSRDLLLVRLPSGRRLSYVRPRVGRNRYGQECITFEGIGESKGWERIETYGPKLVENIVQATSRDLLAEAMLELAGAGYEILIHVHDEVVVEVPLAEGSVDAVCALMSRTPSWAEGLPLSAEGFACEFYRKS